MENRNQYLENDGLYWTSPTHEWFNDNSSTQWANKDTVGQKDGLTNFVCFVIRNKETGEYDRIVVDRDVNEIIFHTKSLEDLSFFIDKEKIIKRFNK